MKPFPALLHKELSYYFSTELIYIIVALFSSICGILFFSYLVSNYQGDDLLFLTQVVQAFFSSLNFLFLFLIPLLSINILSPEISDNTLWLLRYSHLSHGQIILAKFITMAILIIFLLLTTLIYPIILYLSSYRDMGLIVSNYLGLLLNSLFYAAISISCQFLGKPLLSTILSIVIIFSLIMLAPLGQEISNPMLSDMISYLSPTLHLQEFNQGIISSYSFIYFINGIIFFLIVSILFMREER